MAQNFLKLSPSQQQPNENDFANLWKEFNKFYMQIVEGNSKVIKATKKKYGDLLYAPQISINLREMSKVLDRMLRIEDRLNRQMKTVGDCLEYLLKNKVIEALCAYAMIDQPPGFFKLCLNVMSEMIQSINATSILAHSNVHPALNQLLRNIYGELLRINFNEQGEPDLEFIQQQVPNMYESTLEILELINTLAFKVSEEPVLVKVFFSSQVSVIVGGNHSEKVCLPFQILVFYFKNGKSLLNRSERAFLRDIILICFGCMSKDYLFAEYLSQESDFIEILMQSLSSQLENLPRPIQFSRSAPFNVLEQLEIHYNQMIVDQFKEFVENCKFFKDILSHIHNENDKETHLNKGNNEEKNHELQVKDYFSIRFHKLILINIIQPILLNDDDLQQARTALQYLIEIVNILNDQRIARHVLLFLLNKLEKLNYPINSKCYDFINEHITDHMNYYQDGSLSYGAEETYIDYENNNKKRSFNDQQYVERKNNLKQHSYDENLHSSPRNFRGSGNFSESSLKKIDLHSRTISHKDQQKQGSGDSDAKCQKYDPMTHIRLSRIDNLLREAEDIQQIDSEVDQSKEQGVEASLDGYQGLLIQQQVITFFRKEIHGLSTVQLKTIQCLLQTIGVKQFVRDVIIEDINITDKKSNTLLQDTEQIVKGLTMKDINHVEQIVNYISWKQVNFLINQKHQLIECENILLRALLDKLQNFFENKPSENVILSDILLQFFQDYSCFQDNDTFIFILYLLQYDQDYHYSHLLVSIIDKLKEQIQDYNDDQTIMQIKEELENGFELIQDQETSPYYKSQPKILQAENLIILEYLIEQLSFLMCNISLAIKLATSYQLAKIEQDRVMASL